ncbi:hypothetical protein BS78_03G035700 [Paspalum vaginatum]|nr:hypothetical protein BS78_03G035700 [Paspalum vaginatum]
MIPPPLESPTGRSRKQRIKASGEPGNRDPYQCKRCFKFGHIEKGCYATQAELEQELPPPHQKQKKQSLGVTTRSMASLSPASLSMTTRRVASISPASPGVITRRMAFISPRGINRRLIIE